LIGVNATYLGESLATLVMFRDGKSPFTQDDAATLRAIAPIFRTTCAFNSSADSAIVGTGWRIAVFYQQNRLWWKHTEYNMNRL
jgi:hypothetical protein